MSDQLKKIEIDKNSLIIVNVKGRLSNNVREAIAQSVKQDLNEDVSVLIQDDSISFDVFQFNRNIDRKLLEDMKKYIEDAEETISHDSDYDIHYPFKDLYEVGDLLNQKLYDQICKLLEKI
jgi:hypothetical protein